VFDYGPQHQATCGIHFNEPVAGGGKIFGPEWWRGDVFVAGESRGKIWRTKLVKTAAGYVAKNDLIAGLAMLTMRVNDLAKCRSMCKAAGIAPNGVVLNQMAYPTAKAGDVGRALHRGCFVRHEPRRGTGLERQPKR
jgi:hypothetical protein